MSMAFVNIIRPKKMIKPTTYGTVDDLITPYIHRLNLVSIALRIRENK